VVAAVAIAWLRDWRGLLPLLLASYFGVSMLTLDIADPRIAFVTLIVGLFVCLILLITALQVNWGRPEAGVIGTSVAATPPKSHVGALLIRGGVLLLLVAVGWFAAQQWPLPDVPDTLNMPIFTIPLLGIATVIFATDAFKSGVGTLLVLLGLGMLVTAFDQAFAILALLAGLHLLVALVTAFNTIRTYDQNKLTLSSA
jgi:hypothetical protein